MSRKDETLLSTLPPVVVAIRALAEDGQYRPPSTSTSDSPPKSGKPSESSPRTVDAQTAPSPSQQSEVSRTHGSCTISAGDDRALHATARAVLAQLTPGKLIPVTEGDSPASVKGLILHLHLIREEAPDLKLTKGILGAYYRAPSAIGEHAKWAEPEMNPEGARAATDAAIYVRGPG